MKLLKKLKAENVEGMEELQLSVLLHLSLLLALSAFSPGVLSVLNRCRNR